jgi:hypothetical protein
MKLDIEATLDFITTRKVDLAKLLKSLDYEENQVAEASRKHHHIFLDALAFRTTVARKLINKKALLKRVEIDSREQARQQARDAGRKIPLAELAEVAAQDPRVIKLRKDVDHLELLDDYSKALLKTVDNRLFQLRMGTDHHKMEGYLHGQLPNLERYGQQPEDMKTLRDSLRKKYPGGTE